MAKKAAGKSVSRLSDDKSQMVTLRMVENKRVQPFLQQAIQRAQDPVRVIHGVQRLIEEKPDILKCDGDSIIDCVIDAVRFDLSPHGAFSECAMIPRGGRCTFQIMVAGWKRLAEKTGQVRDMAAFIVRDGDHFEREGGLQGKFVHRESPDDERSTRPVTHAYAEVLFTDGTLRREVMDRTELLAHRDQYSDAYRNAERNGKRNSPWHENEIAMMKKTVIIRLAKTLPKIGQLGEALEYDEQLSQIIDATFRVTGDSPVIDHAPEKPKRTQAAAGAARKGGSPQSRHTENPKSEPAAVLDDDANKRLDHFAKLIADMSSSEQIMACGDEMYRGCKSDLEKQAGADIINHRLSQLTEGAAAPAGDENLFDKGNPVAD